LNNLRQHLTAYIFFLTSTRHAYYRLFRTSVVEIGGLLYKGIKGSKVPAEVVDIKVENTITTVAKARCGK